MNFATALLKIGLLLRAGSYMRYNYVHTKGRCYDNTYHQALSRNV
jgi:hypothetical protein